MSFVVPKELREMCLFRLILCPLNISNLSCLRSEDKHLSLSGAVFYIPFKAYLVIITHFQ